MKKNNKIKKTVLTLVASVLLGTAVLALSSCGGDESSDNASTKTSESLGSFGIVIRK